MENNRPPTHARIFHAAQGVQNISCSTRCSIVQKLSGKQSAKEIVGFRDLEHHTARDRKAI